jgi:two-component system cell cycle sensor histidine kinase/response regulator CckA
MGSTKHICQYNQGVYTSIPLIWGGSRLTLKEECCQFEGAPYCEFHMKWPLRNKWHEIVSRFFTSRSVLVDIIKEMEEDKRTIEEKTETLSRMNEQLRNEIADRERMEEALLESQANLGSVFEAVPVGICFMKDRVYMRANQNWCDSFGYPEEMLIGKTTEFLYESREEYERAGEALYGNILEKGIASIHTRLKRSDGEFRDVHLIAKPLDDQDIEAGTVVVVHDVTERNRSEEERKRLEHQLQQAQKMEAIGTLAGGMAHDFNNLLMAIQGRISMMLMDKDSSHPDVEYLKGIEGYVENAAGLTRQLLGFARGGKYEVKPTDLNTLVRNENLMFGRTKKEIIIREEFQGDLWPVDIDRGQIQQVLLNLYVNAWQAMPGGGNLDIKTENVFLNEAAVKAFSVQPGRYVKLSVADTGVGMDEETQERIFDPFFTTKEMGRGTGLGLASVYGIIKNHGGFTEVFSEKGHGSTFSIYLPASEKHPVLEKKSIGGLLRGSETVLLVDDEPMIVEVAGSLLRSLGYNVHTAVSGQEALQLYAENPERIDIVILDMIMPGMGGGETFDRLREMNPHVKVLLSSGYSIDGQASEIMGRGCRGFIQKPFKTKALSRKLREVLEGNNIP